MEMPQFPTEFHQPAGFSMAIFSLPLFRLEVNDKEGMAGFKEEMMNPKVLVWDLKKGKDQPSTFEESGDECGICMITSTPKGCKNETKSHRTNG